MIIVFVSFFVRGWYVLVEGFEGVVFGLVLGFFEVYRLVFLGVDYGFF